MLSFLTCSFLLYLSFLLLNIYTEVDSLSPFECGFSPIGLSHVPFCIKFFLLGLLFLIFDVEVLLLVPSLFTGALVLRFLFILLLGLVFEYSYGSLSWMI